MKEEWLFPHAVVPVDVETTAALVVEIKRLIEVVGGMALAQQPWREFASDYERGVIDGMQMQAQSSVDKAVNAMAQPDAFERGKQEGMKQEHALWKLARLGQEIEAQPAQEPVGYVYSEAGLKSAAIQRDLPNGAPLYAAPLPAQEPVAWCVLEPWLSGKYEAQDCFSDVALDANVGWVPLFTTLPQRPWVGLTEVDILAESKHWRNPEDFLNGVYWAETTLKEKNT